ncbi:hypothetical protein Dcar01_01065 [Deinococcus carri]|uniref:Copper resistance protein CopC n=1 Tax=Deinococcus carri TaxID=1211323 RepID=A0ABP9W5J5_9DEIO
MTQRPDRLARLVRAFLVVLGLTWLSGAAAHAFLVNTLPRAGARFAEAPSQLALQFSEPVSLHSAQIRVRALNGKPRDIPDLRTGADGRNLLAALPPLESGVYVVSWKVVAGDGHLSSGEFAFGVGAQGAIPGVQDNVDTLPLPWVVGSALVLLGLTVSLGGWVSERFVWRRQAVPHAWIGAGAGLAALGSAMHLVSLMASSPSGVILDSGPGVAAVLALLAFLTSAFLARGRSRAWVGFPLVGGALAVGWQGHLGTAESFWFTPLGLAHLLLAAVWVGALVHLAQVLRSGRGGWTDGLRRGAGRYAGLAAWTVLPLLLLGGVLAWPKFAVPAELWTTRYGQLLLAKVALVLLALGLALLARMRAMPARTSGPSHLSRLVPAEGLALLGVLVLSAGLVNATPPQALTAANVLSAPPPAGPAVHAADQIGFLSVYVTAVEGELRVQVAQPTGKPGERTRVRVNGKGPAGSFTLYPRSCGRGCFRAPYEWQNGETTVRVKATDPEWPGGTAEVKLRWPPGPNQAQWLARVVQAMQAAGTFLVTEQALGGLDTSPHTFPLTADTLAATDIYMGGGAEDVRVVGRDEQGNSILSLFVPGSSIWYELHVDRENRIRQERVIAPAYAVQRTIEYPSPQKGSQP